MIPVHIDPKSDQLNADDLTPGTSIIVKVAGVKGGPDNKQAIDIQLVGRDRVYRPCLTMRRVLIACWGGVTHGELDPAAWIGKRMELYNDTSVYFGKDNTGGIRIRNLDGIRERYTMAVTVTKGKRAAYTVGILPPETVAAPAGMAAAWVAEFARHGLTPDDVDAYLSTEDRAWATMSKPERDEFVRLARSADGIAKVRAFLAATSDELPLGGVE